MPRRHCLALVALFLFLALPLSAAPLRVFLRVGMDTHGPGVHDHSTLLKEWKPLLESRGAVVDGGDGFPSAAQLAATDVVVLYAPGAASIHGADRPNLEAYLERGGGIVVLHDAVGGDDPEWFAQLVGGAWKNGQTKEFVGTVGLYITPLDHPITRGAANFDLEDELYYDLLLAPGIRVLANGFHSVFSISPQMWVYEKAGYRSFVAIEGHRWSTFEHVGFRTLVLRGIAWAGRREVDLLTTPAEVAALRYPDGGPQSPETAHLSFQVHPEFDVSLVAAEPLVMNPVAVDWDERGRMWVASTPGYPEKAADSGVPARDEVAILHDDDGDGRMDRKVVFAGGLDLVTSLVRYRDGVIVTAAPDILWLRDTDGDDKADRRVVLYSGFGHKDTHAVIANLRWGADGWIYATQGYSGQDTKSVVGVGNKPLGFVPPGLLRFRPDGTAIESLVSEASNIWGIDLGWDGEVFFSLANNAHLRHQVLSNSTLGTYRVGNVDNWAEVADHTELLPIREHDREPYRQVDYVGGFTAAAGDVVYDGGAWPKEYDQNHFVCEPSVNLVHRDTVQARGPSFVGKAPAKAEFLASTDLWFRPVHLSVGPDGALYVADFYNQAIVHDDARGAAKGPGNAAVRPDRDRLHGRIWRLQHRTASSATAVGVGRELAALHDPNGWRRTTASRLLREPGVTVQADWSELCAQANPQARVHALWLAFDAGAMTETIVRRALADPIPGVRSNGFRIAGLVGKDALEAAGAALARESDPRVRLVALEAVGRALAQSDQAGLDAVIAAAVAVDDDWSRSAALHALAAQPERLVAAGLSGASSAAAVARLGPLVEAAMDRVGESREVAKAEAVLAAIDQAAGSELAARALWRLPQSWPMDVFPQEVAGARPVVAKLLAHGGELTTATLPLAARIQGQDSALNAVVAKVVAAQHAKLQSPSTPLAERMRALRALVAIPTERTTSLQEARALLAKGSPAGVQTATIDELALVRDPTAGSVLTDAFSSLLPGPQEQAFDLLVRRVDWTLRLLNGIAGGTVTRSDLGPAREIKLRRHVDDAVAKRAATVLGPQRDRTPEMDELIARLLPEMQTRGDVARGRVKFEENCQTCHTFRGNGSRFAPDLTGMGAHDPAALLPSIVDPNRTVDPAYYLHIAHTKDGRTLTGILARDTPDEVVLRSADGDTAIARSNLASIEATTESPMPAGFDALGVDGVRDLLTFLRAGYEDYQVLDLEGVVNASTWHGLFDMTRSPTKIGFKRYGVVDSGGVPFQLLDPLRSASGYNALVLRGGVDLDYECKWRAPLRVEIPVGFAVRRVHVLGGIAAWGYPYQAAGTPLVKWIWQYADGQTEERLLADGVEFADWIKPVDVPGSSYVDGLLAEGSHGQVRSFTVTPSRRDVAVRQIVLESFDAHAAPTFLALTAQPAGELMTSALLGQLEGLTALLDKADPASAEVQQATAALFDAASTSAVRLALIEELGSLDSPAGANLLLASFADLSATERERAFQQITGSLEGTHRLLNALATGDLELSALNDDQRARIVHHGESAIARRAKAVLERLATPLAPTTGAYRSIDLAPVATANTAAGLYDEVRAPEPLRIGEFGRNKVFGVPFEVADPATTPSGYNALVLKGGLKLDWHSKRVDPQRVEIPIGYPLQRMHVLGGIAAWGYPYKRNKKTLVRWTWVYADGQREQVALNDGVHFADWLGRDEVPGSRHVRGLLAGDGAGQVRMFSLDPKRPEVAVERIVLESLDGDAAPTFLALTAQVSGVGRGPWLWLGAALVAILAAAGYRRRRRRPNPAGLDSA